MLCRDAASQHPTRDAAASQHPTMDAASQHPRRTLPRRVMLCDDTMTLCSHHTLSLCLPLSSSHLHSSSRHTHPPPLLPPLQPTSGSPLRTLLHSHYSASPLLHLWCPPTPSLLISLSSFSPSLLPPFPPSLSPPYRLRRLLFL